MLFWNGLHTNEVLKWVKKVFFFIIQLNISTSCVYKTLFKSLYTYIIIVFELEPTHCIIWLQPYWSWKQKHWHLSMMLTLESCKKIVKIGMHMTHFVDKLLEISFEHVRVGYLPGADQEVFPMWSILAYV